MADINTPATCRSSSFINCICMTPTWWFYTGFRTRCVFLSKQGWQNIWTEGSSKMLLVCAGSTEVVGLNLKKQNDQCWASYCKVLVITEKQIRKEPPSRDPCCNVTNLLIAPCRHEQLNAYCGRVLINSAWICSEWGLLEKEGFR